jgi:hypothetical protein
LNGAIWQRGGVKLSAIKDLVKYQKRIVKNAEKFADVIVCWSGITHFFTRGVLLHEHMGFPLSSWGELAGVSNESTKSDASAIKVLHSPSSTFAKGTLEIESVISSIQSSGVSLAYERVSGVPNSTVIDKIRESDFVVDQLYADTAGGVFAAESSILGKAVVVGAIDDKWLNEFLGTSTPPTCLIHPGDLEQELRKLATEPEYRLQKANAAKFYFEHLWKPERVARNYISSLQPGEFGIPVVDPNTIHQARGGYASVEQISKQVSDYVKRFGVRALGWTHNPLLEKGVLNTYVPGKKRALS